MTALAALFSTLNARLIPLPRMIGPTATGAIPSAAVVAACNLLPGLHLREGARPFTERHDSRRTLLGAMLLFPLRAGAFQFGNRSLRQGRWPILAPAVVGAPPAPPNRWR